jgi:hypothetical protein
MGITAATAGLGLSLFFGMEKLPVDAGRPNPFYGLIVP